MCAGTLEQAFSVLLLVISTLLCNKVNKRQENLNLQSYVPLSYDPLCAVIMQISTNRKWLIVFLFHWSMPLFIDDHTQISVIFSVSIMTVLLGLDCALKNTLPNVAENHSVQKMKDQL